MKIYGIKLDAGDIAIIIAAAAGAVIVGWAIATLVFL